MAETKYKAEGKVSVSSRLNVRQGNGTGTSIIGKLYNGNTVTITHKTTDKKFNDNGTMRNGYKIEYKGSTAYVCERYVKITKEYKDDNVGQVENVNVTNNQADVYILTGTANIVPNLDVKVRDTVNMQGLGKYLSGAYFVEEVTFEITDRGIKQSLSVSKNAFGGSINSGNPSTTTTTQQAVTPSSSNKRTHTLKKGETLWSLAVKYYGNGTKWTYIAKANGINVNDDKRIRSLKIGEVFVIPYL